MKTPKLAVSKISDVARGQRNTLPIDLIYSEEQSRTKFFGIEELAADIASQGLLQPIIVHAEENGRYKILAGERRWRACKLLNLTEVWIVIKRNLSDLEQRKVHVAENLARENLDLEDTINAVSNDVEKYGLEGALGIWPKSRSWVSKRLAAKQLPPMTFKLIQDEVSTDLELLIPLGKIELTSPELFKELTADIDALNRDVVRRVLAELKGKTKKAPDTETKNPASDVDSATTNNLTTDDNAPAIVQLTVEDTSQVGQELAKQVDSLQTNLRVHASPENQTWLTYCSIAKMLLPAIEQLGAEGVQVIQKLAAELKDTSPSDLLSKLDAFDVSAPVGWDLKA